MLYRCCVTGALLLLDGREDLFLFQFLAICASDLNRAYVIATVMVLLNFSCRRQTGVTCCVAPTDL